jgi:hypothetical protein
VGRRVRQPAARGVALHAQRLHQAPAPPLRLLRLLRRAARLREGSRVQRMQALSQVFRAEARAAEGLLLYSTGTTVMRAGMLRVLLVVCQC